MKFKGEKNKTALVLSSLALAAYGGVSYYFMQHPEYLHGRKFLANEYLSSGRITKIAHRGGAREAPENTLIAFRNAVASGADMIETDVIKTRDDKVITFHDDYMARLCGIDIRKSSQSEYAQFKLARRIQLDFYPSKFLQTDKFVNKDEEIRPPELETALNEIKLPFNIELKDPKAPALDAIRKGKAEDRVIWGTKSLENAKAMRESAPEIPQFVSHEEAIRIFVCYFNGMLPFLRINGDVLQIPFYTEAYKEWRIAQSQSLTEKMMYGFYFTVLQAMRYFNWYKPLIKHLERRGIPTFVWVLNDTESFDNAIQQGVHGIMTDEPSLLNKYLIERSAPKSNEAQ